jgi:hypothetical protein
MVSNIRTITELRGFGDTRIHRRPATAKDHDEQGLSVAAANRRGRHRLRDPGRDAATA